jgi:hypothetical protein
MRDPRSSIWIPIRLQHQSQTCSNECIGDLVLIDKVGTNQ